MLCPFPCLLNVMVMVLMLNSRPYLHKPYVHYSNHILAPKVPPEPLGPIKPPIENDPLQIGPGFSHHDVELSQKTLDTLPAFIELLKKYEIIAKARNLVIITTNYDTKTHHSSVHLTSAHLNRPTLELVRFLGSIYNIASSEQGILLGIAGLRRYCDFYRTLKGDSLPFDLASHTRDSFEINEELKSYMSTEYDLETLGAMGTVYSFIAAIIETADTAHERPSWYPHPRTGLCSRIVLQNLIDTLISKGEFFNTDCSELESLVMGPLDPWYERIMGEERNVGFFVDPFAVVMRQKLLEVAGWI